MGYGMGNVAEKFVDIRLADSPYATYSKKHPVKIEADLSDNMIIIWVLGGPGSGKGTQCNKIVEKYGFTHLSTGDLLREEVKSGTKQAKALEALMKKGQLVPNETVLELLKKAIEKKAADSTGFLIDGYPREVSQGAAFEKAVGNVTVSEKTLVKRCLGRGAASGRVDDNEETLKQRLKAFQREHRAITEEYAHKTVTINGERPENEIFNDVVKCIDAVIKNKQQNRGIFHREEEQRKEEKQRGQRRLSNRVS